MYILICLTSSSSEKFKYSVCQGSLKQMFMGFAFASRSIWVSTNLKMSRLKCSENSQSRQASSCHPASFVSFLRTLPAQGGICWVYCTI